MSVNILKFNGMLLRINRISAWLLLIFIVIYIVSGYAWTNRIIMPLYLARYLHTALDIYMIPLFLAHVLIGTKFTLKRYGVHHDRIVSLALLTIGVISYILVIIIR
ncbi:MAG: hypothetical protein LUQ38_00640 [Methanotrichaceae archaeon]|nr:hypothetical protein [Methanotrichaceae archaeon]